MNNTIPYISSAWPQLPVAILMLLAALIAFAISYYMIPKIIQWAYDKELLDQPNHRKEHQVAIPRLGGIAIILATLVASLPFLWFDVPTQVLYFLGALGILATVGIIDDLKELSAGKKLIVQLIVAAIISYGGIRIDNLGGLLGVYEIPDWAQYSLTILLVTGLMNAFNFIDGIDGLAGGIGCTNALIMASLLLFTGLPFYAILSLALTGAIFAFLFYNFNPAKIFMGDTGSLSIGFILGILGILIIQNNVSNGPISNSIVVVTGILMLPVFDILRISLVRISKGNSPFKADRNHIHHLLIKTGFNHKRSALILYGANLIVILVAFLIKDALAVWQSLLLISLLSIFLMEFLSIKKIFNARSESKSLNYKMEDLKAKNRFLTR